MLDREADLGPRHRKAPNHVETGGIFGSRAAQELTPGGDALEQSLHPHPRAGGQRGGAFLDQRAVVDDSAPPLAAAHPAFEGEARNAGDRGQRFAAKTERCDAFDRARFPQRFGQFRRGVAFERQGHALGIHATAVVDHLDPVDPARREPHRNPASPCIDSVFDQFLQCGGGPLDHLARGDPVDEVRGQAAY